MMDSFLLVIRALFAVFWAEVISRTTGPLALRFLLEPLMATALAICDGMRDGRPLLTTVVKDPAAHRLPAGTSIMSRVFFIAMGMDVLCHYVVMTAVRPLQAMTVAFLLACISYVLVRGWAERLWRWRPQTQAEKMTSLMRRISCDPAAIGGRARRQKP